MKKLCILFLLLFLPWLAFAADHYVSPLGSGTTYSEEVPGAIVAGVAHVTAGDTLFLRGGTYTLSSNLVPANNGTSGARVYVKNYPGETPTIVSTGRQVAFDLEKNYWTFDGISFYSASLPAQEECAFIRVGHEGSAQYTHILNCNFHLAGSTGTAVQPCIMLQNGNCSYVLIQYCTFLGYSKTANGHTAIQALGGSSGSGFGYVIKNNSISTFQKGIFQKHANADSSFGTGAEIGYNYITNCRSGIHGNFRYFNIHDNLITSCTSSIDFGDNGGSIAGYGNLINHNTCYDRIFLRNNTGTQATACTYTNNIIYSLYTEGGGDIYASQTWDYNIYVTGVARGAHDIASTAPTYAGGSDPILSYEVVSGVANNSASDSLDRGAAVALVGPDPGGSTPPTVTITSPTSSATYDNGTDSTFDIGGTTVAGTYTVDHVTWSNDKGGSGTCTGTTAWTQTNIALQNGTNRITIIAYDVNSLSHSDYIDVSYAPADTTAPVCTITTNSGNPYDVGAATTVDLAGTALDANGISSVTWANDRGGSGSCTGTTSWTKTGITLYEGDNVIKITAYDPSNNPGTDTIKVTTNFEPPPNNAPDTPIVTSVEADDSTITTGSTVIFKDDLANFSSYYDTTTTAMAIDTGVGHGGSTNSARFTYSSGVADPGNFMLIFGRNPASQPLRNTEDFTDVYVRLYVLMDSVTQNLCKTSRLSVVAAMNGGWLGGQACIGHLWGQPGSLKLQLEPVSCVSGSTVQCDIYNDTEAFTWLGAQYGGLDLYSTTYLNRWVCLEYHMKLNTPGSSDGILEEWVDGVLDAQQTGLNFRGSYTAYAINMANFEAHIGTPVADSTKHRWMDHVVVSTNYIGLALSPVNPTIYKSAFSDADLGDTQTALNAQVSTAASVTNLVWDGTVNSSSSSIVVNTDNGTFSGALTGKIQLDGSSQYYARTRVSDGDDYSSWSNWYPLKTIDDEQTAPVASFYATPVTGQTPLAVSFYDSSTNTPTSWDWNYGDGTAHGTTQNPTHEYTSNGNYTVTLTATNAGGSDVEMKDDYITVYATVTGGKITGGKTQ